MDKYIYYTNIHVDNNEAYNYCGMPCHLSHPVIDRTVENPGDLVT